MITGLLQLLAASQAISDGPVLASSGPWQVRAEPEYCLLSRQYVADRATTLGVQPVFDSDQVEFVVGTAERGASDRVGKAELRFDADPAISAFFWSYAAQDGKTRLDRIVTDQALTRRLATARTLAVTAGGKRQIFAIAAGSAALRALDACQAQLAADLDIKGDRTALQPFQPNFQKLFNPELYPGTARNARMQGRVSSVLLIGADGRVKACRVIDTPAVVLGRQTCAVVFKYGRFDSAKDGEGKPRPTTYRLTVNWRLPD